jgi:hypothetical protein
VKRNIKYSLVCKSFLMYLYFVALEIKFTITSQINKTCSPSSTRTHKNVMTKESSQWHKNHTYFTPH